MYRAMQQKITGDLAGVRGAMHIALDLYAADNGYDYLGIVIFHQEIVGATMKIKRHLINYIFSFDGDAHTGKNLAKKILEVLTEFGIQHRKFWGLVGDGASNNDTMLEHLAKYKLERHKGHKSRVYCLCHVLNLGAQQAAKPFRKSIAVDSDEEDYDEVDEDADAEEEGNVSASAQNLEHDEDGEALSWALDDEDEDLESDIGREVDDYDIPSIIPNSEDDIVAKRAGLILKKLAYFAKKIRFSPYAKKVFVVACVELKLEQTHNIWRDVCTRWNSTRDMTKDGERTFLVILKVQRDPHLHIPRAFRFDEDDVDHIHNLNRLFSAFKIVTNVISRAEVPMLADVIIHLDSLDYVLGKFCEDGTLPLYMRHAANYAHIKLNEYYSKMDTSDAYRFSILCHPAMRAQYLRMSNWEKSWIDNDIDALAFLYNDKYKPHAQQMNAATSASEVSQFRYSSFASQLYGQEIGTQSAPCCPVHEFVNAPIVLPLPDANGNPVLCNPVLCNPLAWWHSQHVARNEWSGFTQLAMDVLSMP
ncbi:hypothetical protein FRC06_008211, partial [Ceratobasidium sp. 370]